MFVTIRLFARLREIAGAAELQRELPYGATLRTAWESLVSDFPALADYGDAVSCAVNADYARMTATLSDGDEIAFLPPVSGGSDHPSTAPSRLLTAEAVRRRRTPRMTDY
jgi:molybdopterin converting factor subunit 1